MTPDATATPRGRAGGGSADARSAILAAATRLFAERGPDAVSLRQVAREAGLSYGLVYRYFEKREALLSEVMREAFDSGVGLIEGAATVRDALGVLNAALEAGPSWRILAWALLQGHDAVGIGADFPTLRRVVQLKRADGTTYDDDLGPDERTRLALVLSASLGWQLFGAWFSRGVGIDDGDLSTANGVAARLLLDWVDEPRPDDVADTGSGRAGRPPRARPPRRGTGRSAEDPRASPTRRSPG